MSSCNLLKCSSWFDRFFERIDYIRVKMYSYNYTTTETSPTLSFAFEIHSDHQYYHDEVFVTNNHASSTQLLKNSSFDPSEAAWQMSCEAACRIQPITCAPCFNSAGTCLLIQCTDSRSSAIFLSNPLLWSSDTPIPFRSTRFLRVEKSASHENEPYVMLCRCDPIVIGIDRRWTSMPVDFLFLLSRSIHLHCEKRSIPRNELSLRTSVVSRSTFAHRIRRKSGLCGTLLLGTNSFPEQRFFVVLGDSSFSSSW